MAAQVIQMSICLLLVCICGIHATIYINTTLPDEAFNSENQQKPQCELKKLTVEHVNGINNLLVTFKISLKNRLIDTQWDGNWFVNGSKVTAIPYFFNHSKFAHSTKHYWENDYVLVVFILSSTLPAEQLRYVTFNLRVQFSESDDLAKRSTGQILWFYRILSYNIKLYGDHIEFPSAGKVDNKFDKLQYSIRKNKDARKYQTLFSFSKFSKSYVSMMSAKFEGLNANSVQMRYTSGKSSCGAVCYNDSELVKMSKKSTGYRKTRSQANYVELSTDTSGTYEGVYTVSAKTRNRLNSDITLTFDLTSYLYDGIGPIFLGNRFLYITNFSMSMLSDKKAMLTCRVLGNTYNDVTLYKVNDQGQRDEIQSVLFNNPLSVYVKTLVYEFAWSMKNRGTYICRVTRQHYPYNTEKTLSF